MASVTITTTGPQDLRIQAAYTDYLRLESPATTSDIKQELIDHIRNIVFSYERRLSVINPLDPS